MKSRMPLPLLALLTAGLSFSLAACSNGEEKTTAENETEMAGGEGSDFDPEKYAPKSFDESKIVPDGTKSTDGQVVKDIKKQTLPTDVYIERSSESMIKAEEVYLNKCLKEKGVDFQLPSVTYSKTKKPIDPSVNPASGLVYFSPENAKKFGYFGGYAAFAPNDDSMSKYYDAKNKVSESAWVEKTNKDGETEYEEDPEKAKDPIYVALTDCENEMFEKASFIHDFGQAEVEENKEFNFEDQLKSDASTALYLLNPSKTPQVKAAAKEWKKCMKPVGIADLPDDPSQMPPSSISEKIFSPETAPKEGEAPKVTGEHSDIAVKDAECRESSNYNRMYYDAHWVILDEFVTKNAKDLREAQQRRMDREEKRESFILENS